MATAAGDAMLENVLRCLIVDDNRSFLEAAANLLEQDGVMVAGVASTASDAVESVQRLDPEVVLVDIMLGTESGFDLARQLAASWPDTTLILISTHGEADFADLIEESPAVGFISKSHLSAATVRRMANRPEPGK